MNEFPEGILCKAIPRLIIRPAMRPIGERLSDQFTVKFTLEDLIVYVARYGVSHDREYCVL